MTTRRRYLAGLGTITLSALAGCDALEGGDGTAGDRIEQADLDGWTPDPVQVPSALPFSLPTDLAETHEDRTRSLLDRVPQDPSIPNGVIEDRIREQRAALLTRVEDGPDVEREIVGLRMWRDHRSNAANLYGQYNAGTGKNEGETIEERRDSLREQRGKLTANVDYSAASPIEAVLVYARVEDLLHEAGQESLPHHPYPAEPIANVEQAGHAFESVEAAEAALEDARGIQDSYLDTRQETTARWSTLIERFRGLEIAVERTRRDRVPTPETADHESLFGIELDGVEFELFRVARRGALFAHDPLRSYRQRSQYANAVLEAGRRLASIAAFDAVITALEEGETGNLRTEDTGDGQSVADIQKAATNASGVLEALQDVEYPHLSVAIAERAVSGYRTGRRNLGDEYFDPEQAEAAFRYASVYAAAAPQAASFVADQIDDGL